MSIDLEAVLNGTRRELCSMPWREYFAYPALNPSTIVHGRKSMLHLKHAWDGEDEDSDEKQFGRMMHCLLFEHSEFERRYWPWDGRRAGNDYLDFQVRATAAGAEVVKATGKHSLEAALEAAQGFLWHPLVKRIISAGQWEQTVFAVEEGLQCKGRLDGISTAEHCIADLKSSTDISHRAFGRTFARLGYHLKLGLYKRWLDAVTGDDWPVKCICLESKPPYDVTVVPIHPAVLDAGVDRAMEIIRGVRRCIDSGEWPGIAPREEYGLDFPEYEMDDTETVGFEG